MTDHTEAGQLLKSGAIYVRRAGLRDADGTLVFAGVKPGAFSLYFGDAPIIHTDLEGRWQRVYWRENDTHFVKPLGGEVSAIARVRDGGRLHIERRRLSFAEAADLDAWVRQRALDLLEHHAAGRQEYVPPPPAARSLEMTDLLALLDRIARWDADAWFRNREAHQRAYGGSSLGFLPPTCAQPIVLQATIDDSTSLDWLFGRATTAVAPRTPDEFGDHVRQVRPLLASRAAQARGIVLADSHALAQPTTLIRQWLEIATQAFPIVDEKSRFKQERDPVEPVLDGVYAFAAHLPPRSQDDWAVLRAAGLRHVDLGLVAGSDRISQIHGLPSLASAFTATVDALKAVGISLGIVLVLGCGGKALGDEFVSSTVGLVSRLSLGKGDLVYLVNLDAASRSHFDARLTQFGMAPLNDAQLDTQSARFVVELTAWRRERGVKLAPYSLDKQASFGI